VLSAKCGRGVQRGEIFWRCEGIQYLKGRNKIDAEERERPISFFLSFQRKAFVY
jgi:hypothetical protein